MKLLKLVPDNTNIDFMRWRNLARGPVDIADDRVARLHRLSRAQSRRRFRRRAGDPRDLRPAGRRRAVARPGRQPPPRRGEHPGIRRRPGATRSGCPSRAGPMPRPMSRRTRSSNWWRRPIPGARVDAVETVSGKVSEELAQRRGAGDRARDARDRDLHLVPVRMAVRGRGAGHPASRCRHDAGLFRLHPACRSTSTWSPRS